MTWLVPLFSSMASALPPDEKSGAVESMVMLSAAELGELLPSASVATAVMALLPSVSAADAGTVKDQLPEPSAVVLPREVEPAKSSTVLLASAFPLKLGVGLLVRLSELEVPVSDVGVRSGVEGAAGAVSSRSLMARVTDCSSELPASSVAMTVKE